jgi:hypothetical protein
MLFTQMTAGLAVSSAYMIGSANVATPRMSAPMMATIGSELGSMDGPDIYWGEKGPLQNPMKEESDFKEYDSYSTFLGACSEHGVDLNAPDITVLAPGNAACAEYTSVYGPLSKAVCEYHVIKGTVNLDSLSSASLATVEGNTVTYRRMFRKHFLDNGFVGAMAAPPRSSFKGDIKADNGLIHMINEVIYPGWSESAGMEGSEATRA